MNQFLNEIKQASTIAISGHERPDGDCVGSCLGLYNYITENYKEKKVSLFLDPIKESFSYIAHFDKVQEELEEEAKYDLVIVLDCGDIERLGKRSKLFYQGNRTVCIDHHITNTGFSDVCIIDAKASSTCEVLFEQLELEAISHNVAVALYTGIIHDTGVLKYSNTSKRTLQIVGELVEKGVDTAKIIDDSFFQKTYVQNQILGRALLESVLVLDGKCIYSEIKHKYFEFYEATSADLSGIIDQLRITKGVEVAILATEKEPGQYKVSMRSNGKVDVSVIASYFGGGGHIKASGCTMSGSIYDVINNLTLHIERQLNGET